MNNPIILREKGDIDSILGILVCNNSNLTLDFLKEEINNVKKELNIKRISSDNIHLIINSLLLKWEQFEVSFFEDFSSLAI